VSFRPPQISLEVTRVETRDFTLRSQHLAASVMAQPLVMDVLDIIIVLLDSGGVIALSQ
jgi:hypothetical protein